MNGEAVYGTKGDSVIGQQHQWVFTHKADATYAIYRSTETEPGIAARLVINHLPNRQIKEITMLGNNQKLRWRQTGDELTILLPEQLRRKLPCKEAWVFKIAY